MKGRNFLAEFIGTFTLIFVGVAAICANHSTDGGLGLTGIALAHAGFRGVRSLVGAPDLFGRPLRMTQVNVVDAIASAAVLAMGEGSERCPLAIIQSSEVEFCEAVDSVHIPIEEDIYGPLLRRR